MKLSLWTNYFVDRDQQQGQQIRATIERPYGREPVVGEVMHFIGAALEVTSVRWLEDGCGGRHRGDDRQLPARGRIRMMHYWSGPYGIPGGTERWEHGSYRLRRLVEVVVLVVILAPQVLGVAEVVVGVGLMALGLLWLVGRSTRRRNFLQRVDVLALLVAVVALVEARRRP